MDMTISITVTTIAHALAKDELGCGEPLPSDTKRGEYSRAFTFYLANLRKILNVEGRNPIFNFNVITTSKPGAKPLTAPVYDGEKIPLLFAIQQMSLAGWSIPKELINRLPVPDRKQISPDYEISERTAREFEKALITLGAALYTLADDKPNLNLSEGLRVDAVAELLSSKLSHANGQALHGFSITSLSALINKAEPAYLEASKNLN